MYTIIAKVLPIILIFILGYTLKRTNFFKKEHGDIFLKIVFYIAVPALLLLNLPRIELSWEFIYLPLAPIFIVFVTYFMSRLVGKHLKLKQTTMGVILVGTLIMNIGFTLPFFIAAYGKEGLIRALMFDFTNSFLTFTFVYYLACKHGAGTSSSSPIKRVLTSAPMWAMLIGIILNLTNMPLPDVFNNIFSILGNLMAPLLMLALGIHFRPGIVYGRPLTVSLIIRMGVGLGLGVLFVTIFDIDGLNKSIILVGSAAPIGYNTLTYASIEKMDQEFAASLVSISIIVGIIFIPFLIFVLG